jgi:hypothetical protein
MTLVAAGKVETSRYLARETLVRVRAIKPAGPPVRRLNNTLHAIESLPVQVVPA